MTFLWLSVVLLSVCAGISAKTTYTIKKGDTLWGIAQRFDVPLAELLQANQLTESSVLQLGRELVIPSRGTSRLPQRSKRATVGPALYVIEKGDYIEKIAQKLGCSLSELLQLNGITRETILQPGQQLKVPGDAAHSIPARADQGAATKEKPAAHAPSTSSGADKAVSHASKRPTYLYVQREDVILRSAASTQGERLGIMPQGTVLEVLQPVGPWWKVRTPAGAEGYVAGWLVASKPAHGETPRATVVAAQVTPTSADDRNRQSARSTKVPSPNRPDEALSPVAARQAFVSASRAHVRREPDLESSSLTLLAHGERVKVVGAQSGWLKVELEEGGEGWMHASTLRYRGPGAPLPSGSGERIVAVAQRYLGTPYHFGGSSSRGTDCSGFVVMVFRSLGVDLPHSSAGQFRHGRWVERGELRAGDLVFFRDTYRSGISHVGIYVGGGRFVHASTRGRQVRVDSLDSSYYASHYAGARRLEVPGK